MFERVAIVETGGAAARGVRSIGAIRPADTGPRTVLLYHGGTPRASLRRAFDEVVAVPSPERPGAADTPGTLDADLLATCLARVAADAVWVGWGAPADHATIARACEAAGVTFVGPSAEALAATSESTAQTRLLCESMAPFGSPVVPEV